MWSIIRGSLVVEPYNEAFHARLALPMRGYIHIRTRGEIEIFSDRKNIKRDKIKTSPQAKRHKLSLLGQTSLLQLL